MNGNGRIIAATSKSVNIYFDTIIISITCGVFNTSAENCGAPLPSKCRKHIADAFEVGIACKVHKFARTAQLNLYRAVFDRLRTDGDAHGVSDEIAVVELDARAFPAVVQQDIDARRAQFLVDLLGIGEAR